MASNILFLASDVAEAQSKRQTLNEIEQQIRELQSRRRVLVEELAGQNRHVGSIQALPSEILSIIFKIYLEYSPRFIRRLMLVCRQWYRVSVDNPYFWTSIEICSGDFESDYEWGVVRLRPYIEACIKHSNPALLHLSLDFGCAVSWNQRVADQMASTLTTLHPNVDENAVNVWSTGQDWSWCWEDDEEDPPGHYSHFLPLLKCLGPMRRWASLDVGMPAEKEVAQQVLAMISGAAPALLSLYISWNEYLITMDGIPRIVFRNLISLITLKLPDIRLVDTVSLASSLQSLDIMAYLEEEIIAILNTLDRLHTLKLSPPGIPSPSSIRDAPPLTIPTLQTLYIIDVSPTTFWPRFSLPLLKRLIFTYQNREFFDSLPPLNPIHVEWYTSWTYRGGMEGIAEKVLAKYPQSKHITSPFKFKEAVIASILRMKRSNQRLTLETVKFKDPHRDFVETIAVNDI